MRILIVSIWLMGILAGPVAGQTKQSPRDLVEKAVQAMGGLEKLHQPGASFRQVKGEFPEDGYRFSGKTYSESPKRVKITHIADEGNGPSKRTMVFEGDSGWFQMDGLFRVLDDETLARMKRARFADRIAGLVVLLEEDGYKLSHLGEVKVKERSALGVKVKYEGQPDMHLYFDKETGLLVKTWQKFREAGTNEEVVHELYYSDFKTYNPVEAEEALLKKASLSTKGPELVEFLRKKTPSEKIKVRIRALVGQLGSPSFSTRIKATVELKKIGLPAVPFLKKVVDNPDPEVSQRARDCLDHIANDNTSQLLPAVVRLISWHKPKGSAKVLLDYLPWADKSLAKEIKAALLVLADSQKKAPADLLEALKSKHPIVQEAAKAALRRDKGAYAKLPGRRLLIPGLQFATHCEMYRNGKRHMVLQTLELEYYNGLEDSLFARPDQNAP